MTAFRNILLLGMLGLIAAPVAAQHYLGYPTYAEWKAATHGVTLSDHPATLAAPTPHLRGNV